jgi:hypothetical protein
MLRPYSLWGNRVLHANAMNYHRVSADCAHEGRAYNRLVGIDRRY